NVWLWLVQMGQDRGGFYSYSWLERLFGDPVRNADRVVPEWQNVKPGDLVRAAPPNYLGGIAGDTVGWRVAELIPGRALILDGWGAFVLEPVDDSTTRLLVRSRAATPASLSALLFAPFQLLVLEPAHFIM